MGGRAAPARVAATTAALFAVDCRCSAPASSHCHRESALDDFEAVEILLVEDSDADAELIIRALRKSNLVNKVVRLRDGVEAIEFVFREGAFSQRRGGQPRLILLDLKMPRLGGIDVLRRLKSRRTDQNDSRRRAHVVGGRAGRRG